MKLCIFLVLLGLSCVWCHSIKEERRVREHRAKIEYAFEIYFETGQLSDFLAEILKVMWNKLTQVNATGDIGYALCFPCKWGLAIALPFIRTGAISEDKLGNILTETCVTLNFQTREVCEPLIKDNLKVIYYIIQKNPGLTSDRICATIAQKYDCEGAIPEWSIQIAPGETKQRQWGSTSNGKLHILQITDIHYDPNYSQGSPDNCREPICCQRDSRDKNGTSKPAGYWSSYPKCDTPLVTIEETLKHIKQRHEKIDYVYFTGDIISHRIWDRTIESNKKDISVINDLFRKYFGDVTVLSILGNHEPHPLNLFAPLSEKKFSTQWLYDTVAQNWNHWLPKEAIDTVKAGGYYSISPRKGFRIIGLNSNPCYTLNWWLLDGAGNHTQAELEWLSKELHKAEENNENVHILSHVPSGDNTCYKIWSREFRRLIERYSNIITAIFNGHTHKDEMILYHSSKNQNKAISVAWNGGSLTTYEGLNLNYRIYDVHPDNFEILDYHEYTFDLNKANIEKKIEWFKLYSFKSAYNVSSLAPESVRNLVVKMSKDKHLMQQYERFTSRNSTSKALKPCDDYCLKNLHCNMLRSDSKDTSQCTLLQTTW